MQVSHDPLHVTFWQLGFRNQERCWHWLFLWLWVTKSFISPAFHQHLWNFSRLKCRTIKHLIPHSSWQFFLNHPLKGTANYLNLRDFTLNKFQFLFSLGKWKYLVILDLGFPVTTNGDSWVTAVSMVAMHLSCFLIQVASLIYIPSLAPMGLWLCDLCSRQ